MGTPNLNAPNSSFSNAGGNVTNVNYNYIFPQADHESGSPTNDSPLFFNDAPVDRLTIHFTGREDELIFIRDSLKAILGDVPIRFIIHGMRGVGKSQLTLQFAKLAFDARQYSNVFWIPATTVERLNQGFAKLLDLIGHPDRSHPAQITKLTVVRRWLEEFDSGNWLLVLDGVESETINFLREHLPRKNRRGHILITTSVKSVAEALAEVAGNRHQIFELRIPAVREAASLLLNHGEGEKGDEEHMKKAEDVAQCVGRLPLALAHAGLFMKQSGTSLDEMLALYHSKYKIDIIRWENELSSYHEKSVAATFSSQLEDLEHRSPDVNNFLIAISFFDPDAIAVDVILKGAEAVSRWSSLPSSDPTSSTNITLSSSAKALLDLIQSPIRLQSAIVQLQNRSLVNYQCNTTVSTLHIHSLIQFMIQDHASKGGLDEQWFDFAVNLVSGAFHLVEDPTQPESWNQCELLIPHIQSLNLWDENHGSEKIVLLRANERVARYFHVRKRYDEAESLLRRLLGWKERRFEPDHNETLASMHELGRVYHSQRRYIEAETHFGHVLSIRETRFGPDDPQTLETMNSLAEVWDSLGRYRDAEKLYTRIVGSRERRYGPDDMNTLTAVVNLANVYKSQGRYSEAAALLVSVLQSWEKQLGVNNPSTQSTMSGLAEVYYREERLDEAQHLYERVLAGQEKQFGADHPDTLLTAKSLAAVYLSKGSFTEAFPIYNRILPHWERQFGTQHPETLTIASNLAAVFESQGWFDEAVALYEQVLAKCENVFGADHPETLKTMDNLAGVYRGEGRYREAEEMYRKVLDGEVRVLGAEHPSALAVMNNLAIVCQVQDRYEEAQELLERVLDMRERILGPEHPVTLSTLNNLASVHLAQDRYPDAEKLMKRMLNAQEKHLGLRHPDTLATLNNLASVYRSQGRYEEAEKMLKRLLDAQERIFGMDHPDTLVTSHHLALVRQTQEPGMDI